MTSWSDRSRPLLTGPVRAIRDWKAKDIRIETTKDHDAGEGLVVCRLAMDRVEDARAIVALPDLLRSALPFAALGHELAEEEAEEPLITDPAVMLEITVGDVQLIASACDRALPQENSAPPRAPLRRGSGRRFRRKARPS
jgi:hypothetical protein